MTTMPVLLLLACGRTAGCAAPTEPVVEPAASSPLEPIAPGSDLRIGAPVQLGASRGMVLEEYAWSFRGDEGWAWVVRFPRDARLTIHPSPSIRTLSEFPVVREGEVLINGGFYDDGPMGLVVHEGVERAPLTKGGGSGVLFWSGNNGVDVVHRDAWSGQGNEALQSIDRLVDAGRSLVQVRPEAPSAARAAVGVSSEHVLAVVVATPDQGEEPHANTRRGALESAGLPLWAFADLLVWLGAERAVNMDGGISTELRARIDGREFELSGGPGTINAVRLSAAAPR